MQIIKIIRTLVTVSLKDSGNKEEGEISGDVCQAESPLMWAMRLNRA